MFIELLSISKATPNKVAIQMVMRELLDHGIKDPSLSLIASVCHLGKDVVIDAVKFWESLEFLQVDRVGSRNRYLYAGPPAWLKSQNFESVLKEFTKGELSKKAKAVLTSNFQPSREYSEMLLSQPKPAQRVIAEDYLKFLRHYQQMYKHYFEGELPRIRRTEREKLKWFIIDCAGVDQAIHVLEYIFGTWHDLLVRWHLNPLSWPTVGIIYGYGRQLIPYLFGQYKYGLNWRPPVQSGEKDEVIIRH